jgi:hypothetical protein
MTLTPVSESTVLWRFLSGQQEAYCLLLPSPVGHEIRYFFNGVQLIGIAADDLSELEQRAGLWKLRLVAEGWAEVPPRLNDAYAPRTRAASG